MRLLITAPAVLVADSADVISVRAEDESGSFGILEGHADLLNALLFRMVTTLDAQMTSASGFSSQ